jgi:hypothetical protein
VAASWRWSSRHRQYVLGLEQAVGAAPVLDPRVVAGSHLVRPIRPHGATGQEVELDLLVAGLARVRRGAVEVRIRECIDHLGAELGLHVEHEERDPNPIGHPPGVVRRLR